MEYLLVVHFLQNTFLFWNVWFNFAQFLTVAKFPIITGTIGGLEIIILLYIKHFRYCILSLNAINSLQEVKIAKIFLPVTLDLISKVDATYEYVEI